MTTADQYIRLTLAFGKAMQNADAKDAQFFFKDILGIDPEVYEWNHAEMLKAAMQKIEGMKSVDLNNLLAKMGTIGGKEASQLVSGLFIMQEAEERERKAEMEARLIPMEPPRMKGITTRSDEIREYQTCRCCDCGTITVCTPANDFYGTDGGLLHCEQCMLKSVGVTKPIVHVVHTRDGKSKHVPKEEFVTLVEAQEKESKNP